MKFFQSYQKYTNETEPPKNFHVWTGIGAISAMLGRKCYIPQGFFTVHPNLYIVLVGPAGVKKSSAMNIGKQLLRSIDDFPLAPSSTTREALLKNLQDNSVEYTHAGRTASYHQSSAFVTELQEFIGGKHINSGMIGIMTALWDEPTFEYVTANKDPIIINSPYFTLLGCCTKDWITTKLKGDVISDGFARRCIFVLEDKRSDFCPWPTMTAAKTDAFTTMTREAARINEITGKFRFTNAARELWDKLYREIQSEVDEKDAYVQNYYSTKHILMLKVCMCLCAASGNHMIVDAKLLQLVHELFLHTEQNLLDVFAGLGRNELAVYHQQILEFIQERWTKDKTPTETGDVVNRFTRDMSLEEIRVALDTLTLGKSTEMYNAGLMNFKPSVEKVVTERKNMFDLINNYRFNSKEQCDDSPEAELERMVDSTTLKEIATSEDRVKRLMDHGTLATAKELQNTVLPPEKKSKGRKLK